LVEAMLSGIPIIVSDIDVFKEQVDDRISAQLFKVGDAEDLAKKMKWVIDNYPEAIKLGENARKLAEKKFDIETIVKQTEDFYNQIAVEK